jgi:hypothetical protein
MTYEIARMRMRHQNYVVEVGMRWDKHEGFCVVIDDARSGPTEYRCYASLSSALSAMSRVVKKLEQDGFR